MIDFKEFKLLKPITNIQYMKDYNNYIEGTYNDVPQDAYGAVINMFVPYCTEDNKTLSVLGVYKIIIGKRYTIDEAMNITKNEKVKKDLLKYKDLKIADGIDKRPMDIVYPDINENKNNIQNSERFYPISQNDIVCNNYDEFVKQIMMAKSRFEKLNKFIINQNNGED